MIGTSVAALAKAVDALLDVPLDLLPEGQLLPMAEAIEVQRRRLEAVDQKLLAAAAVGRPGLADALVTLLRIDVREAKRRVARSVDLGPRRALSGEELEPLLPSAAKAAEVGEMSAAQTDVLLDTVNDLPPTASADAVRVVEQVLVDAARFENPRLLSRTGRYLLARLDPDGPEPAEEAAQRNRAFTLVKRADGTSTPRGDFTVEATAVLETVFDALAAPQSTAEQPDTRTAAQRRHDGLVDALSRVLRSGTLPAAGGAPVTILATTTIAELTAAANSTATTGLAALAHGQTIPVKSLLHLACEANIVPVVFDDTGGILAYGRSERCATPAQRRALAARDGGCTFPGCERPPAWCDAHHVIAWIDDGPTDLDNLVLLCRHHHRSFAGWGWDLRMTDGRPEWLPPPWIDPQRRPRRNPAHQRPELVLRQPAAVP